MKGELGSPRLGLSPCHIVCVGLEVLRPQDILAMWSRFSGCAHKQALTHIRGRDHREWGQGRGGPWGGNSDRNMHCFSLDWGKDHLVGPHMESRSEHLHWLWWGVLWRELDTPRLKWTRGGGGASSKSLSRPWFLWVLSHSLLGPKERWCPEASQGVVCAVLSLLGV